METKNEMSGINLEKEAQHTPQEIMQQMIDALIIAVHGRLLSGETAGTVVEITRELIHWSFSKPGAHGAPSELLAATLAMSDDNVFGNFGANSKTKDGKPKLDA